MKHINWKIRVKNPYVWIPIIITLVSTLISASGYNINEIKMTDLPRIFLKGLNMPSVWIALCSAFYGIINDPTTHGFKDSDIALEYNEPKKSINKSQEEE